MTQQGQKQVGNQLSKDKIKSAMDKDEVAV